MGKVSGLSVQIAAHRVMAGSVETAASSGSVETAGEGCGTRHVRDQAPSGAPGARGLLASKLARPRVPLTYVAASCWSIACSTREPGGR